MIRQEEVINLAVLARLELADSEVEPLCRDLESILGYVARLKVETATLATAPRVRTLADNTLRVDVLPHSAGAFTESLLTASPEHRDGYLVVKPIFSQDGN